MNMPVECMFHIWAKTNRDATSNDDRTLPLLLHMIDVACAAEIIIEQWCIKFDDDATLAFRTISLFLAGAHDIGKVIPQFQRQHEQSYLFLREHLDFYDASLIKPYGVATYVPHGFASFAVLNHYLRDELQMNRTSARWLSRGVAGHHGIFPSMDDVKNFRPGSFVMGTSTSWATVRTEMLNILADLFHITKPFTGHICLSHANIIKLAGLTTVADWIASQATDFNWQQKYSDIPTYYAQTKSRMYGVLSRLHWERAPLKSSIVLSDILQGRTPRPLHSAVATLMQSMDAQLVIIEAPTGEGKTEASFVVAVANAKRTGHLSTFFALPTQATSNQMYGRVADWLQGMLDRQILTHLVHGGNAFSDAYGQLKQQMAIIYDDNDSIENGLQADSWFTSTKRIMLATQGVGTIDQALMSVLKTKHGFVRLLGLAQKVVIIDEVHAYDVYTSTLLDNLLAWLKSLGCTVVLLSATLPATRRRQLLNTWGITGHTDIAYPRLIGVDEHGKIEQHSIMSSQAGRCVTITCVDATVTYIARFAEQQVNNGGVALIICNTVARSQEIYREIMRTHPTYEVVLLHSRMTNAHRAKIEQRVTNALGRDSKRPYKMIVVGTQVLEQSLDIDADVLITDIAPVDLLIQRMGRLHRHNRSIRPALLRTPTMYVATVVPTFVDSSWFGDVGIVYEPSVLLRTYAWLQHHQHMMIPEDIEPAIDAVYERTLNPSAYQAYLSNADAQFDEQINKKIWLGTMQLIGEPSQTTELFEGNQVLGSDDEDATHYLRPRTRDGDASLAVLCIQRVEDIMMINEIKISLSVPPSFYQLKQIFLPAILKVSSNRLNRLIKQHCFIPQIWRSVAVLRSVHVLFVASDGTTNIPDVQYQDDLGLYLLTAPLTEAEYV